MWFPRELRFHYVVAPPVLYCDDHMAPPPPSAAAGEAFIKKLLEGIKV